ncbi:hypothetical protein [Isoptericola sp. NPDC057191]|uniref:hypothetical protein n=1 Tax=Isoptericola sp. NPDC057191 TaxID=3346041 RepID=UPI00362E4D62
MTLLVVVLLCAAGVVGGYGLGRAVDGVQGMLAGPESLPADKIAAPAPLDAGGPATTCRPEDVELRLSPSATTVTAGSPMSFMVRVTNVGRVPCLLDGSAASRAVTITDPTGKERVWSSSDCSEGSRMLLLGPEDVNVGEVHWSSRVSGKGCKNQPTVAAGTYEATASLADVPGATSDPVVFTVAEKAKSPVAPDEKATGGVTDGATSGGDGEDDAATAGDAQRESEDATPDDTTSTTTDDAGSGKKTGAERAADRKAAADEKASERA